MLAPIPSRILTDSVTFSVPSGTDVYQTPTVTTYTVSKVHLQSSNQTKKTTDNTEVVLRSILFIDSRLSSPVYDFEALQKTAQTAGGLMTCTVTDKRGNSTGPYTVLTVDAVPDDCGNIHHFELGLV